VGLKRRIGTGWDEIDARAVSTIELGKDQEGRPIAARIGRYGPYVQVGDTDQRANIPENIPPDELSIESASAFLKQAAEGDKVLGVDPQTGKNIYVKSGRFGPYVKMGSETRSLDSHAQLATITLDEALSLLAEPKKSGRGRASQRMLKELGRHPESGEPLTVKSGRFGPYVTDGVVNASLPKGVDPITLTVERAAELIKAREDRMRSQGKDPRAKKAPKQKAPKRKSAGKSARKRVGSTTG
jgi:DNA topoisomerase-1